MGMGRAHGGGIRQHARDVRDLLKPLGQLQLAAYVALRHQHHGGRGLAERIVDGLGVARHTGLAALGRSHAVGERGVRLRQEARHHQQQHEREHGNAQRRQHLPTPLNMGRNRRCFVLSISL